MSWLRANRVSGPVAKRETRTVKCRKLQGGLVRLCCERRAVRLGRRPAPACPSSARSRLRPGTRSSRRSRAASASSRGRRSASTAVRRRVDRRGQHRVDQDVSPSSSAASDCVSAATPGLRCRRRRSCRRAACTTGRAATLTIRPPLAGLAHRLDRLAAREEAGHRVEPPLLLEVGERRLGRSAPSRSRRRGGSTPTARAAPRRTPLTCASSSSETFGAALHAIRACRWAGSAASIIGRCTVAPRASNTSTTPAPSAPVPPVTTMFMPGRLHAHYRMIEPHAAWNVSSAALRPFVRLPSQIDENTACVGPDRSRD